MIRLLFLMMGLFGSMAHADGLMEPQGPVVLTVFGNITHTNGDGVAEFDRDMLAALVQRTTTASTPWFDEPRDFTGPLATAILDAVGAQGSMMRVIALNDYAASVPIDDAHNFPIVFATHLDGNVMSVRDKGPLFLIYPFDEYPELFNEIYFGRSVWQIAQIEVVE
ncbi:MAG: hypothetical protein KIH44_008620 [Octadecabacter sp.]|nr:hypothetical protein [Octadecabacter sp.]